VTPPLHLMSAARALEQILGELHPERHWIVRIREHDALNGNASVNRYRGNARTKTQHASPVNDGTDTSTATRPLDKNAFDQAA
jgi:hypothetical protein